MCMIRAECSDRGFRGSVIFLEFHVKALKARSYNKERETNLKGKFCRILVADSYVLRGVSTR